MKVFAKIFLLLLPLVYFFSQPLIFGQFFNPTLFMVGLIIAVTIATTANKPEHKQGFQLFLLFSFFLLLFLVFSFLRIPNNLKTASFKTSLFFYVSMLAFYVSLFLFTNKTVNKIVQYFSYTFLVVNFLLLLVYIDIHFLNSKFNLIGLVILSRIKEAIAMFGSGEGALDTFSYRLSFGNAIEAAFVNAFFVLICFLNIAQSKQKNILTATIILTILAVIFSFSRSPLLIIILFAIVKFFKPKYIKQLLIFAFFVSLLLVFDESMREDFFQRFFSSETVKGGSADERTMIYIVGGKIFADYPFFGTGFGTFIHHFSKYTYYKQSAESTFLQILVEGGIVGMIIFIALFFCPIFIISFASKYPLYKQTLTIIIPISIVFLFVPIEPANPLLFLLFGLLIRTALAEKVSYNESTV